MKALSGKRNSKTEEQKNKAIKLLKDVGKISFHAFLRPQDTNKQGIIIKCHEYLKEKWAEYAFENQLIPDLSEDLFIWPQIVIDKFFDYLFPKFRTASFSRRKNNAAIWGHYAAAQNGVCLEFNVSVENNRRSIAFEAAFAKEIFFMQ